MRYEIVQHLRWNRKYTTALGSSLTAQNTPQTLILFIPSAVKAHDVQQASIANQSMEVMLDT